MSGRLGGGGPRCYRCGRPRDEHGPASIERCSQYRGPGILERVTDRLGLRRSMTGAVRRVIRDALGAPRERDDNRAEG